MMSDTNHLQVAIFTVISDKARDLSGSDIQRGDMCAGGHSFDTERISFNFLVTIVSVQSLSSLDVPFNDLDGTWTLVFCFGHSSVCCLALVQLHDQSVGQLHVDGC